MACFLIFVLHKANLHIANATTVFTWNNPAGGIWSDPSNWTTSDGSVGIPNGLTDNAIIDLPGDYTVNVDVDFTVFQLFLDAPGLTLEANDRNLVVEADCCTPSDSFVVKRALLKNSTIIGGYHNPVGNNEVNSFPLSGSGILNGVGDIRLVTENFLNLDISYEGVINSQGGVFEIGGNQVLGQSAVLRVPNGNITNRGRFTSVAGNNTRRSIEASIDNQGLFEILAGRRFDRFETRDATFFTKPNARHFNSGHFFVNSNGAVEFNSPGGVFTNEAGGIFEGQGGIIVFRNQTFRYEGGTVIGGINMNDSRLELSGVGNSDGLFQGFFFHGTGNTLSGDVASPSSPIAPRQTLVISSSTLTADDSFINGGQINIGINSIALSPPVSRLAVGAGSTLINTGRITSIEGNGRREFGTNLDNRGELEVLAGVRFGQLDSNRATFFSKPNATHFNSGRIHVSADGWLSFNGQGSTFVNQINGEIDVPGGVMGFQNGTFRFEGGSISGSGVDLVNTRLELLGPGAGKFRIFQTGHTMLGDILPPADAAPSAHSLQILATSFNNVSITADDSFTNGGQINIGGNPATRNHTARLTVQGGGKLVNTGEIISLTGISVRRFIDAELDNQGLLDVRAGDHLGQPFNSDLTISAPGAEHKNSGEIHLTNVGVVTFGGNGTFVNEEAGMISGNGQYIVRNASFVNEGTISPGESAGLLTQHGTYTESPTASLEIEIGGTSLGIEYDHFQVHGSAILEGSLEVSFIDGFIPSLDDSFTVMTTTEGPINGTFVNAVDSLVLPGLGRFDVVYTGNHVQLSNFVAVPEPTTAMLLLTALAAFLMHKRAILKIGH